MTNILSLPSELITGVAVYLPDKDLAHLAQTSSSLNLILSRPLLARALEDQPPPVIKVHALLWAINHGHTSLVETIVSQPNFTIYGRGGTQNALVLAAELGHSDMIPVLIATGYDVSWSGSKSPLRAAVENAHPTAVTQLLNYGAQVNKKDENGRTVLGSAIGAPWIIWRKTAPVGISDNDNLHLIREIEARVVTTIKVLLDRGAQLDQRDDRGNTLLHLAVLECLDSPLDLRVGTSILRLLVEAGCSLSARNLDYNTPVELAVSYPTRCSTALAFFLDQGVSPNTKTGSGTSLLQYAVTCYQDALPIMQVLLDRGAAAKDFNLLRFLQVSGSPDPVLFGRILTLLLTHGATFGEDGSTCFTYAAMHGMLDVMKVVLETCPGIDINTRVCGGHYYQPRAPLEIAIADNRDDIIQFLLASGLEM